MNEELTNKQLENISKYTALTSKNLNSKDKIKPSENADNNLETSIKMAKQIITDLNISIPELRKQNLELRNAFRNNGNTNREVLNNIRISQGTGNLFLALMGKNMYENYVRLPILVKAINNINQKRATDGTGYKDFSKEIEELNNDYEFFLDKRNASVQTNTYFNYWGKYDIQNTTSYGRNRKSR